MAKRLKFLVDEHIHLPVVKAMRDQNTDIVSLGEVGLLSASDGDILKFANNEDRIIVTMDNDFLVLNSKGEKHKGIIFLTKWLNIGDTIRELENIELTYNSEDLVGVVLYIPQKG